MDNEDEHHKEIIKRQTKNDKDKDTSKNFVYLPIESTVVVPCEDWGMIKGKGDHNHHDRSYHLHITKIGRLGT